MNTVLMNDKKRKNLIQWFSDSFKNLKSIYMWIEGFFLGTTSSIGQGFLIHR